MGVLPPGEDRGAITNEPMEGLITMPALAATGGSNAKAAGRSNGSNGPLERITVNLTGRASRALDLATELTGDTKTDTVNRALQVYAYLEQITARGGSIHVREAAESELERLKMF
jgi:hypothetical protein